MPVGEAEATGEGLHARVSTSTQVGFRFVYVCTLVTCEVSVVLESVDGSVLLFLLNQHHLVHIRLSRYCLKHDIPLRLEFSLFHTTSNYY